MSDVTVIVKTKGADAAAKEIKDIGDQAEKASGPTGRLGASLGNVGSVAAGFVVAGGIQQIGGFLTSAAQAAAEDEQSTARLSATIRSLGGDFDSQMGKVQDAIKSGQDLAFTDDDIRDSFDKLAQATGNSDEALKRQKLAMDLARGANIPLADASKLLGKVTDENLQVFKRLGITLPDVASEADVLAAVQGKFAGQADAYANSTAGQFEQTQIRMDELKEAIGARLLPVMNGIGAALLDYVIPAFEKIAANFDIIGPILAGFAVAIGAVLVPAFVAWAAAAGAAAIATIAAAAPAIAVGLAVAALVAGVILLIQNWDTITAKFPLLGTAADGVKTALDTFLGWVTGTLIPGALGVYNAIHDPIAAVITWVTEHWGDIQAVIEPALTVLVTLIGTQIDLARVAIETAVGLITGIFTTLAAFLSGDFTGAWNGIKQTIGTVWDAATGIVFIITNAISEIGKVLNSATGGVLGDILGGVVTGFTAMATGVKGVIDKLWDDYIKPGLNLVIAGMNKFINFLNVFKIPGFHIKGAGPIPDIDFGGWGGFGIPAIPTLAEGGIVTRPTLALIGEAGPEAVVPLNRSNSSLMGGAPTFIIYANVPIEVLAAELQRSGAMGIPA